MAATAIVPVTRVLVLAVSCCLLALLASCGGPDETSEQRQDEPGTRTGETRPAETTATPAQAAYQELASEHGAGEVPEPREPEEAYALRLAEHGEDYSECGEESSAATRTCEKPASLGERELKKNINVQLILDASGSMRDTAGAERKIDVARSVLIDFIDTLPESANVSLRVYGHVGSSERSDRERSCAASEVILPFQELDRQKFADSINSFEPKGWTPVAGSLEKAGEDFAELDPETNSNFVYMVSDGRETCGGDPVAAARELAAEDIRAEVNIVGFDVDREAAGQLQEAASSAGGAYYGADSAEELNEVFRERFDWTEWTAYYNCIQGNAYREYNAETGDAYTNYNCLTNLAYREYNAVTDAAYTRYNEVTGAAYDLYNDISNEVYGNAEYDEIESEVMDLAAERRDARLEAAEAERDYSLQQAGEQRDAIVESAEAERDTEVAEALEQRDAVLDSVEAGREEIED